MVLFLILHTGGRIFTIFYVLIGLVFIFAIINDFAQSIIRAAEAKALEKLDDDPTDDKVLSTKIRLLVCRKYINIIGTTCSKDWSICVCDSALCAGGYSFLQVQ